VKTLALQRAPDMARSARAPAPPAALLAQRQSTLGGGSVAAPPLLGQGRPLEPATRQHMEHGFGRDFGAIRVHDDARAHDDARSLGALAYAAGDNIVFGEGQYRPQTPAGQALIAHELAHSVQQGGVQMKADGPLPVGADAQLEAQADRAALDVTSGRQASGLSRIAAPAVFRADTPVVGGPPPPAVTGSAPVAAGPPPVVAGPPPPTVNNSPQILPKWVTSTIGDDLTNAAPTELIVTKDLFEMPVEKGAGPWVEEAYKKGNFASTVYTKDKASSFKEDSKSAFYRDMWLNKFGFSTMAGLAGAIVLKKGKNTNVTNAFADANFATYVQKLAGGLQKSSSAIDHIVEKHMGGASVPDNLQLHDAARNSASGTQSWNKVVDLANEVIAPGMRGNSCQKIQIRFKKVSLQPAGPQDPTYQVEKLLRDGDVKGSDVVKAAAQGKPVMLKAGVNQAIADIKDTGPSLIQNDACRVVSGANLIRYERGAAGAKSKTDYVDGELDNRALKKTGTAAANSGIRFQAVIAPAAATPAAVAPTAAPAAAATAVTPAPAAAAEPVASQVRTLSVAPGPKKIPFEYLYLSPGHLSSIAFDEKGQLTGKGVIDPSVKFLGQLEIAYGPDKLELVSKLDVKKLNSSAFMKPLAGYFRFTEGDIKLDLLKFKPEGTLSFTMGPSEKPLIKGEVKAGLDGGAFVAKGTVKPGIAIPGIDDATGTVEYHSVKGWSGSLQAKSSKIPNIVLDASLNFHEVDGKFITGATGGLTATVKDKTFGLIAHWSQGKLAFSAPFKWVKPFSIVDQISGSAYYSEGYLKLTGGGSFTFRNTWKGSINVTYERFADGREKFYGDGNVDVVTKNKKGSGSLIGHIDEKGRLSGTGTISYQVTPTIRPEFTVTLKAGKLTIAGSVTLGPYELFKRFPKKDEGLRTLFKITSPPWSIPTPIPGVRAYVKLFAGVQYQVYFGPGVLKTITVSGQFDPLEEDPAISAKIAAEFECEAGAMLVGTFGATLGVDVLLGAGAVEGTITVGPYIKANVLAKATASGEYKDGDFTVGLKPEFSLNLMAGFTVSGSVAISALWGALSHTWTFPIAAVERPLASKTIAFDDLTLTLGSGKGLPGAQEKATLPNLDPKDIVKGLLDSPKDASKPNPDYDPNAREPIERGFKV
jgi:Domain of unknown function (DUF4157)